MCAHSGTLRLIRAIEQDASDPAVLLAPGPATAELLELCYATIEVPALLTSDSGGRSSVVTSSTAQSAHG